MGWYKWSPIEAASGEYNQAGLVGIYGPLCHPLCANLLQTDPLLQENVETHTAMGSSEDFFGSGKVACEPSIAEHRVAVLSDLPRDPRIKTTWVSAPVARSSS